MMETDRQHSEKPVAPGSTGTSGHDPLSSSGNASRLNQSGGPATPNSDEAPSDEVAKSLYSHMEDIHNAQKELMSRPHFSVRRQIYIGNLIVFLFTALIAVVMILNNEMVQARINFLEFVNEFSSEVQQARRYEKNFFLYGSNLADALENIRLAKSIFIRESDSFSELQGKQKHQQMLSQIDSYEALLKELAKKALLSDFTHDQKTGEAASNAAHTMSAKGLEHQLREYGQEILESAQQMMSAEKKALEKTLSRASNIRVYSILVLLVLLAFNAYFLVKRLYSTLDRFAAYAHRIASGDFSPIVPKRRYRDEFTDLSIVINDMIKEIDTREAALIQTHKMRAVGTLTAGIAHELNNPLNNIMLTAHMVMEDYHDLPDEERLEMIQDMAEETDRAKKIIRNLLDFARESTSTMESMDLSELLKGTIKLLENQIRLAGITVDLQFGEALPRVHGDAQKLQQVFVNLLLNAMDASEKGSKIQVMGYLGEKAEYVKVNVIDYGQGIPKHLISSVFDPFFTTKQKGKGTGLGLSVSQGIVAKHGGMIEVKSDEGSGSCFTVSLPVITFPGLPSFQI